MQELNRFLLLIALSIVPLTDGIAAASEQSGTSCNATASEEADCDCSASCAAGEVAECYSRDWAVTISAGCKCDGEFEELCIYTKSDQSCWCKNSRDSFFFPLEEEIS